MLQVVGKHQDANVHDCQYEFVDLVEGLFFFYYAAGRNRIIMNYLLFGDRVDRTK